MTPVDTKFVLHDLCVMANVTISMDDEVLDWARVEAARSGQSMSAWMAAQITRSKLHNASVDEDIAAILATPKTHMSEGGRVFVREECYNRKILRRF